MEINQKTTKWHHRAAQAAMNAGKLRDAHQHCLAILNIDPAHADAWFLCGVIAAHNGQGDQSVKILRRAINLAPENAEYHAELGKQLAAMLQPQVALEHATIALSLAPAEPPVLNTLGTVFSHLGVHEQAVSCYEKAVTTLEQRAENAPVKNWLADLYFNFATSLNFAGRVDQAEQAYEKAIDLRPRLFKAHSALSHLHIQTPERNHLHRLESLRVQVRDPLDKLHLGHALAKEYEDLGRYSTALENLRWANAGRASEVSYRSADDAALFDTLESQFTKSLINSSVRGCDNAEPVFIVGMPRTGTTLVERILASHSKVFAAGELQNFPRQVKQMCDTTSAEMLDRGTFEQSLRLDMSALGAGYIDSTRPRTGHTARFIDKLPLNFMYLGLIRLALPKAKLICLRRDPMDTCLSNYRQLFATGFKHYYYSYDLLDCGRYYLRFDQLMRHWREVMPGAVHELQYETLVEEPERCTRELLQFCDLPWENRCLDFHTLGGSVGTASATQVRQPVYKSSVGRWRRYGDALQPLYDMLSSAGYYP